MGYLLLRQILNMKIDFANVMKSTEKSIKATGAWVKEKRYTIDPVKKCIYIHDCGP